MLENAFNQSRYTMLVYAHLLGISDEYNIQKRNLLGMKMLEIEVA